jgi:hypothetical protein
MNLNKTIWLDKFEAKYEVKNPGRGKYTREYLEKQAVYKIVADPFGYRFGDVAELLTKSLKFDGWKGFDNSRRTWLREVVISENGGDNRPATIEELESWNQEYFSMLKPLVLGEHFDVSDLDSYNGEIRDLGFVIATNGLLGQVDSAETISECFKEVHKELLRSEVESGRIALKPPDQMNSQTAENIRATNNPLKMAAWTLDAGSLQKHLAGLAGNWQRIGPSSLEQLTKPYSEQSGFSVYRKPSYTINAIAYDWFEAFYGDKRPDYYPEQWAANVNELYRAFMGEEIKEIEPDPHFDKSTKDRFLGARVSVDAAVGFLEKRGVKVVVYQPETHASVVSGGALQADRAITIDKQLQGVGPALPSIDYALYATPEQLVEAFNQFGLHSKVFTRVSSFQWLSAANKVKGSGRRGGKIKPLFCPYEVMIAMSSGKLRKFKCSPNRGWTALQRYFPKVVEAHDAEFKAHEARNELTRTLEA